MRLYNFKKILFGAALAVASVGLSSCVGDLDVENINPQKETSTNFDYILNKVYANMVLTGQKGPDGEGDLDDIDEGTSSLIRQLWNAQSLTTDEAKCVWGDEGIPEFNYNAWSDAHKMMKALYYRLYFGVTMANYYLENANGNDAETLTKRAEARFMRALYMYYLMDLWGNVPIKLSVSAESTPQSSRAEVFAFVEKELKDVCGDGEGNEVLADKASTYGRADKVAAWILLSRLYLNAEVYTGKANWEGAKTYAGKAIASPYSLCTTGKNGYSAYQLLFMGDNDTNGAQTEIVLPAIHDGIDTQTWGGCLFIIASTNGKEDGKPIIDLGSSESWGGNRATMQYVQKFVADDSNIKDIKNPADVAAAAGDDRALFSTYKHKMNMDDESDFFSGFAYNKFTNKHADGTDPKHEQFVDTDFPMIRLAEAYLNYAEADARLNNNRCTADGLNKIKELRDRAHASTV
ncbi:MAG: RagB/SusD family nutrient uptake outer membrane protein [Bacteroidales bacterium]|nr:RagB/SusD family nutrient uptake outer membrane protein [Bacteroidales bacterium]